MKISDIHLMILKTLHIMVVKAIRFNIKEYIVAWLEMSGISFQVDTLLQSKNDETLKFALQYKQLTTHHSEEMKDAN